MSIVNIKELINSSFRGNVYIVQGEEILCESVIQVLLIWQMKFRMH